VSGNDEAARKERMRQIYRHEDACRRVRDAICREANAFHDIDRLLVLESIKRFVNNFDDYIEEPAVSQ
jgi:hypothetical protein